MYLKPFGVVVVVVSVLDVESVVLDFLAVVDFVEVVLEFDLGAVIVVVDFDSVHVGAVVVVLLVYLHSATFPTMQRLHPHEVCR